MTRDEAYALHRELENLMGRGPGGITENERARFGQIKRAFRMAQETDSYLNQKVFQACEYLGIWLSPRRWQQWGSNPENFRVIVANAVHVTRMAIDTRFPASPQTEGEGDGQTR